ncbi:MAG: hypothetical protein O0X49_06730 [Methanocorpusculum sp.]|nr:hypothetical protein [Methanocorpusculum sp.]
MLKKCIGCGKTHSFLVIILIAAIMMGVCVFFIFGVTFPYGQNVSSVVPVNVSSSGNNSSSLFCHWQDLTMEKVGIRTVTEQDMIAFIVKWNELRNWGASDAEILSAVQTLKGAAIKANVSSETIPFIRLGKPEWDEYEYVIDHMPRFCAEVARLLGQSETEIVEFPDAVLIDEWEERFGCRNSNSPNCLSFIPIFLK